MAYGKLAAALLSILAFLTFNTAALASQHQCTAGKIGATGKKAYKKASCHATAASNGAVVEGDCLAKPEIPFSAKFAKSEANPPCFATGDEATIEGKVDTFVDDLAMTLRPSMTESSCASRKLRAAGKKAFKVLNCHRKAVNKGETVDPACVSFHPPSGKCSRKIGRSLPPQTWLVRCQVRCRIMSFIPQGLQRTRKIQTVLLR